jgi:hypothetical protein
MKISEFSSKTRWIVFVMTFPVICGTSHNSSRLESYGFVKLENPHVFLESPRRSKKSNYSRNS